MKNTSLVFSVSCKSDLLGQSSKTYSLITFSGKLKTD